MTTVKKTSVLCSGNGAALAEWGDHIEEYEIGNVCRDPENESAVALAA